MMRAELADTLAELIAALEASARGARITEASVETPMEVSFALGPQGITFHAAPTRSRFVSGIMQPVHRICFTAIRDTAEPDESAAAAHGLSCPVGARAAPGPTGPAPVKVRREAAP